MIARNELGPRSRTIRAAVRAWIAASLVATMAASAAAQAAPAAPAAAPAPATATAKASAAPANGDDAAYKELIRAALVEMEAHNYAEARALFLKAHALQPSARTLRALGNAEFELKRYAQAIRYFDAALASTAHALTAEMRQEMLRALNRAESYCGRFELALEPQGARLTVDGEPAQLESDGTLLLDLGDHALALTAEGYLTSQRSLVVNGGEHAKLPWSLARAEVAIVGATPPPGSDGSAPSAATGGTVFGKWWFWTAVGVVATGSIVGIAAASSGGGGIQSPLQGNLGSTRALLTVGR